MIPPLPELCDLVRAAARDELLPRYAQVEREHKADGSLVTAADRAMEHRLDTDLKARWPDIGFFSEEMSAADRSTFLDSPSARWWCLDPLDGTSNFAAGIPFFAVSLALIDAEGVSEGVIYDPERDECFSAARGAGAFLNGERFRIKGGIALRRALAIVDFKRLPRSLALGLAHKPPFASQRNYGASALEWAWLACGRGHVTVHGGQNLWDYAAGSLLLAEAGGYSTTLQGEPVFSASAQVRSVVGALDESLHRE